MADERQVGDVVVKVGEAPALLPMRNKIGQGPLANLVRAMERVEAEYGGKPPDGAWFAGLIVRKTHDAGQALRWPSMCSARGVIGAFNRLATAKGKPWAAGLAEVGGHLQVVVVHTATPGVMAGRTEAKGERVIGVSPEFAGVVVTGGVVTAQPEPEPAPRSEEAKAAELSLTLKKLSGRAPVAGFDTGPGGRRGRAWIGRAGLSGGEE